MRFYFSLVLLFLLLLMVLVAVTFLCIIWIRRNKYTRERYAFVSVSAMLSMTLALFACLSQNMMPWYAGIAIFNFLFKSNLAIPEPKFSDYALLILVYLAGLLFMRSLHKNWDGLKSTDQYRREQRSEHIGFVEEGIYEVRRIIKHKPPPEPYSKPDWRQYVQQLEPITDSFAWKDQARELIELSSSSYAFDPDSGWHDKEGCWVGANVDTSELVILYPTQEAVNDTQVTKFVQYADQLAAKQAKNISEIIIAVKGQDAGDAKVSGRPIRVETEEKLLDNLVRFTDYKNEINKRAGIIRLADSELSLKDVFTPSRYLLHGEDEPRDNVENYLLEWLSEPGQRQLALLGEYGQGKSTTALMFTYHLLNSPDVEKRRLPIWIELRGKSPRSQRPLEFLGAWAAQYNINPKALMRLHIAGRLLLIFEGFDEMELVGDAELRLRHFKTLWQFCYPTAKILITGRPNFFLDQEEMKAGLGISKPVGGGPYCEDVRLAPFTIKQIEQSLRCHEPQVRDQISSLAKKTPGFLDLISRPSLLHLVSVLWERERLAEKVDQLTSAYVMDLFVRSSYRRQGAKEDDSPGFMALNTSERDFFMKGIATYMASNELPNQISNAQLNELIEILIESIPDSVSVEAPAILGEISKPLRLRLEGSEQGIEHVKTDVRACGLLVDDPASPGTFRFGHKSFMEYLFASVIAERVQNEELERARSILYTTKANISDITALPVSIHFLAEIIGRTGTTLESSHTDRTNSKLLRDVYLQLFRTIIGMRGFGIVNARLGLFELVMRELLREMGTTKGTILRFILLPPISIMLLGAIVSGIFATVLRDTVMNEGMSPPFWSSPFRLGMVVFMIFYTLSIVQMFSYRRNQQRLRLWLFLCKEIGAKDRVLHGIIGTSLFPFLRRLSLDGVVEEFKIS